MQNMKKLSDRQKESTYLTILARSFANSKGTKHFESHSSSSNLWSPQAPVSNTNLLKWVSPPLLDQYLEISCSAKNNKVK